MALIIKLNEHKPEFYRIFDAEIQKNGTMISADGKISHDELIKSHLNAWKMSRIDGVSASLAFYCEAPEAIKLIDKLAKEYFGLINERV